MNKLNTILLVSIALCLLAGMPLSIRGATGHRTLQVKVNYTGAGMVDKNHRIYVLLFDSNPYTASSLIDSTSATTPPAAAAGVSHILRRFSASRKNETITFKYLSSSPVYAAAFVDQNGNYDGHSDPAPGGPMGAYGKAPGKLAPIKLKDGKRVRIVIAFDDSAKIP
jgi:hypothetical protein